MSLFNELRRRNVIRVALAYIAGGWLVLQVLDTLQPVLPFEEGQALRATIIVLAIGFLPALILAWKFEWTPAGLVRETDLPPDQPRSSSRTLDRIVTLALVVAVAYFAVDKFLLSAPRPFDNSVAVLQFANLADPESAYLSQGVTEDIVNRMANVAGIHVRPTPRSLGDTDTSAAEMAEELGVRYVLTGSVRKAGDLVRVTAQLIDGRNDRHVWSEQYDREIELSEALQLQDDIASRVVDKLKLDLIEEDRGEVDPVAYNAELRARYLIDLYDPDNVAEIEQLIAEGLDADPEHAPLYWLNKRLTAHKVFWRLIPRETGEQMDVADNARLRELDPDSVLWLLAESRTKDSRQGGADTLAEAYRRAPRDEYVIENVARGARYLGKFDVAIALGKYLVDQDPTNGRYYFRLGATYREAGYFDEAIEALEASLLYGTGLELGAQLSIGVAYLLSGQSERARDEFVQGEPGLRREVGLTMAAYDLGDSETYEALRAELWSSGDWFMRATISAWTGDADTAFDYLETGYSRGEMRRSYKYFVDHSFSRIWDDPRWDDLMRRLGTSDDDIAATDLDIELPWGYELD